MERKMTVMVTVDIESLYTNIRHSDALEALKWALTKQCTIKKIQIQYLIKGLKLAMSNIFFWANNQNYNQTGGVAMGTRYAPSVANVVLNKWEQESVFKNRNKSLCFYRRTVVNYLDLDLTISKKGNKFETKTYFKTTDRNGFVPTTSCPHPQWIGAIPKGQYMRLRCNCPTNEDFVTQADVLTIFF